MTRPFALILMLAPLAATAGGKETFDDDKAGAPARSFEAVVGDWYAA